MSKTRKSVLSRKNKKQSRRRHGKKHVRFTRRPRTLPVGSLRPRIIRGGSAFFPPTVGGNMPPLPTGSFYPFSENTGGALDPTTPANVISDRNTVW